MRPLSFVRKKIFCFESLLKVFCWQEKRRRSRRRRLSAGKRASSLSRSSNPPLCQCANPFSAATKNSSTDHPLFLSPTKFCEMGMQLCICVFGRFLSLCIFFLYLCIFLWYAAPQFEMGLDWRAAAIREEFAPRVDAATILNYYCRLIFTENCPLRCNQVLPSLLNPNQGLSNYCNLFIQGVLKISV